MTHLRAVDVQNDLCASILSDYADHRAEIARIRAEAQAKSIAAHPSRAAARLGQSLEQYAATVKANRERVIELREFLVDPCPVIDLAERRGGRNA